MKKILLITPPFLQINAPYPATPYLSGYLQRAGVEVEQYDLSIELICKIFSSDFLEQVFKLYADKENPDFARIFALRRRYIATVEPVVRFLQGGDPTLANQICMPDFLPQASRFESIGDLVESFGQIGTSDCAKYLATLYLQDISDFIRAVVTPHFEIVRYAEKISVSLADFSVIAQELSKPLNLIELEMVKLLDEVIGRNIPNYVGFTIPFPGNLLSSLRCAQHIKKQYPDIKTIAGGGYLSTELRSMSEKRIFDYFDFLVLDDGELSLERIINGGKLIHTYTPDCYHDNSESITHQQRGCPDFSGLPNNKYISLCENINPMHRLWSDGRWNKMMIAHGCYWSKCSFCDTSVDYIKCYSSTSASQTVDWMVQVAEQTGSYGFHFVDEAAPPKLLKEISLELLRRGLRFTWWTNIRFEQAFTGDLCALMAAAGCIAVSGGLEVATDRLLELINKGVTIEQATIAMRNFYYSGIMVHSYLMYGLPTQTLQDSVDSLEVVRQMFRAELIGSAFWHRYAMTVHSPMGQSPESFKVKRKDKQPNSFANNEVHFAEDRGYNINIVGDALRGSLANYLVGQNLELAVHKWFECKAQPTTVEPTLITDHLIKPDSSRIYNPRARVVWIGGEVVKSTEGIVIHSPSEEKEIKFSPKDADFIAEAVIICSDLEHVITFSDLDSLYKKHSEELFLVLYHSKKWDQMRKFGLLQI